MYANWSSRFAQYLALTKPKVVALMIVTVIVSIYLADNTNYVLYFFAPFGIACLASAAAVINQILEQHIDRKMSRTQHRPLATGVLGTNHAGYFALTLAVLGTLVLGTTVNLLTTMLTIATFFGYSVVYTVVLKPLTPQNIVIGGLAGAMPPLLGWTSATNTVAALPLLLVLIIFVWTPPHFWALCIAKKIDYENANMPMLPVTHGIALTKLHILLYSILLLLVSSLPFIIGNCGAIYLAGSLLLNSYFLYHALILYLANDATQEIHLGFKLFKCSILYLFLLFMLLAFEHRILASLVSNN